MASFDLTTKNLSNGCNLFVGANYEAAHTAHQAHDDWHEGDQAKSPDQAFKSDFQSRLPSVGHSDWFRATTHSKSSLRGACQHVAWSNRRVKAPSRLLRAENDGDRDGLDG